MREEPFTGRGAGLAGSGVTGAVLTGAGGVLAAACGAGVAPGVAGVVGCGVLEFLLNIVTGLYEAEGVFGAAVNPHFVVQVRAG
jgi:hypothetical protein